MSVNGYYKKITCCYICHVNTILFIVCYIFWMFRFYWFKTSLYILDDFNTLEIFFFGDMIGDTNDLIVDKVDLACVMISSSAIIYQTSVNDNGTQLTWEYAVCLFKCY